MIERRLIAVEGIVQGVGFRPYVHSLAMARNLEGYVRNTASGLMIDIQGDCTALDDFVAVLIAAPPPLAMIASVESTAATVRSRAGFSIVESADAAATEGYDGLFLNTPGTRRLTLAPPDIATCRDCLDELFNPDDRRFEYPFINCTQCGPRLTILRSLPYDRPATTMAAFVMCAECRAEYEDPRDRRFHAQPIACANCGPRLWLIETSSPHTERCTVDSLGTAVRALVAGNIVAIKGLGGYHIACDATNRDAVERLRTRKHREAKPLAIMAPDVEGLSLLCDVSSEDRALLESRERPIVLLGKRLYAPDSIESVSPRNAFIGGMLPYTPLHHLLLKAVGRPLVMTSGNLSDDPISFEDDDAIEHLSPIADLILGHDRDIATRCDDSVMRVINATPVFIRRSRGFAPRPIALPLSFPSHTLAMGGHLKNTFCLGRERLAFVSHHIGDLENAAAYRSLEEGIKHYSALAGVTPDTVAHDLHPGYMSTQIAQKLTGLNRIAVQHHHAHIASCMAENGVTEPVIGVAFDGAGLGEDGAIWGGEFLLVDRDGYERVGHLGYVPLPGGEAAVRRPLRMALAHLWAAFDGDIERAGSALAGRAGTQEWSVLAQMLSRQLNSPPTSSAGRLFDAVASLCGIRDDAQFEGQAAMELEAIADHATPRRYPVDVTDSPDGLVADPGSIIRAVASDISSGVPISEISGALHHSLSGMIASIAQTVRDRTGVNRIALSGGVFQNVLLTTLSAAGLQAAGFDVFQHRIVPCNDGGLSLGQAYVVALGSKEA